ncbi:MAG: zinc-ribbon domain-containing protein [Phycisphaerae bacterium]
MVLLTYFVWGPATFVVMLIAGLLLVLGALLLGGSSRKRKKACGEHTCEKCGHANRANARFCARCGHDLHETIS